MTKVGYFFKYFCKNGIKSVYLLINPFLSQVKFCLCLKIFSILTCSLESRKYHKRCDTLILTKFNKHKISSPGDQGHVEFFVLFAICLVWIVKELSKHSFPLCGPPRIVSTACEKDVEVVPKTSIYETHYYRLPVMNFGFTHKIDKFSFRFW